MSARREARTINLAFGTVLTCCTLVLLAQVRPSETAAGDIQQANQPPPTQITGVESLALGSNLPLPRLPNINIFISKNEIKKLLGIDSPIHYVTNGNINTYPFTFTIPLGYNQSDIIFTWQNLGQTNVNYSISLTIGNLMAVEAPLINITRSGLIPRHEQVFKITLPCSGRMTDEVDVQVLINVSGFVAPDETLDGEPMQLEPQSAASTASKVDESSPAPQRSVSHTLAIKRKKICTMQQIQVIPTLRPELPATAPPPPPSLFRQGNAAQNETQQMRNSHLARQQQQQQSTEAEFGQPTLPPPPPAPVPAAPPTNPELEESTRKLIDVNLIPAPRLQSPVASNKHRHQVASFSDQPPRVYSDQQLNMLRPELGDFARQQQQQQQPQVVVGATGSSPLVLTLMALSMLVSVALVAALVLSSSPSRTTRRRSPLDKVRAALTGCLLVRRSKPTAAQLAKCKSPMAGAVISSLRAGPKSPGALVSASGHSKAPAYCFKSAGQTTCGYYSQQQQQQYATTAHHYQQPPTADLLGTGYQCQQQQQHQQYPIYHITGANSQTTRLIWNNGNGTSPDGFTIDGGSYMPLSNAPRSDTGSLYQTIY